MNLTQHISNFIENHQLNDTSTFIIGVSGGADSVACLLAFKELGSNIIAAHVNYQLRETESDGDEQFVIELCKKHNIPYHIQSIDCKEYCNNNNLSVQEGAREIRYNFFQRLLEQSQADYIVTAHHKNDLSETVLLHLFRGTGSKGLIGIPEKRGTIIRPLLNASKTEIENYLKEKNQTYRADSSNNKNDYNRNYIRNKILPVIEQRFDNAIQQISKTSNQIKSDYELLEVLANDKLPIQFETEFSIDNAFFTAKYFALLRHQLSKLNFSSTQIENMITSQRTGTIFFSTTHTSTNTGNSYLFKPIDESNDAFYEFQSIDELQNHYLFSEVSLLDTINEKLLKTTKNVAYLDLNKISFPLTIRNWKKGDRFQPIGMKGAKKVSDLLNDQKINLLDKDKVQVLISNNKIIWVINLRLAENVKISNESKKMLKLVTQHKS